MNVGLVQYWARRYNEAIQEFGRAVALDPNFFQTYQSLGWAHVQTSAYDQAIAELKKAIDLGGGTQIETDLAHAYAVSGHAREAVALLNQILDRRTYVSAFDVALVYAGLGDRDRAFGWLERACDERTRPILSLHINPKLDGLRSDPRFAALMRRVRVFDAEGASPDGALRTQPAAVSR